MIPPWTYLDDQDRVAFRATVAFLEKRLADSGTIDWALRLEPIDPIKRMAVEHLLSSSGGPVLDEPWATAWRLIEESWSSNPVEKGPSTAIYDIQKRLRAGDRSGGIVAAIVNLVAPRLKVKPIESWPRQFVKKPRHPKTFNHLLSARLSSGKLVDLNLLGLATLADVPFLKALANALEGAVSRGLDTGRRLGWDGHKGFWELGNLGRVYYVASAPGAGEDEEPDRYHRGIAPSVKLLYAVIARIADLEPKAASPFVVRWRLVGSPVHIRLWAAAARAPQLVSEREVASFLLGADDREFWDLYGFPEIAELRATRFGDLDEETQAAITTRLRKGPPRHHWPRKAEAEKIRNARLYWSVRELKRIKLAGNELPPRAKAWLEDQVGQFAELGRMSIEEGFPESITVRSIPPNPDDRYDTLEGAARLQALETALAANRGGWDDDPAKRASDWLRENTVLVLGDLAAFRNGGDEFPRVWGRFGGIHSPRQPRPAGAVQRDLQGEADEVLALLNQLSENTLAAAIEGVSDWLDSWKEQVVVSLSGLPVWLRAWPIAVESTNARPERQDKVDLSVIGGSIGDDDNDDDDDDDDDDGRIDFDTLNTPAGKLVGVFLAACPQLSLGSNPFVTGSIVRQMRDTIIGAVGRSGLIVRHRLIEGLPYFLSADPYWAKQYLIAPLLNDDSASLALWQAIARRTHFTEALKIIGGVMADRSTDRRLGRETRRSLVFSLVIESLHAFREGRAPAVPNPRVQQLLRTLEDEVRSNAASAIQRFVRDLSTKRREDENPPSAAKLFRSAALPFLREVWPQERSLATPGVSGALADLPATSEDAFAEAVHEIERFLVPFECWSMYDYGLKGDGSEAKKLSTIDNEIKAKALLRLLDLTIGSAESAVIPHDLTDALDQIRSVAPQLTENATYRRLATAARRT